MTALPVARSISPDRRCAQYENENRHHYINCSRNCNKHQKYFQLHFIDLIIYFKNLVSCFLHQLLPIDFNL